jgi:hypothetical protein
MPADAPPPAQQRWRDVDGTPFPCSARWNKSPTGPNRRCWVPGYISAATSSAAALPRFTCAFRTIR